MTVESAEDLAGMFAVEDFAVSAAYAPRADRTLTPASVSVILTDSQEMVGYGAVTGRARSCLISAAALEYEPQRGDELTLPSGVFQVQAVEATQDFAVYALTLSVA